MTPWLETCRLCVADIREVLDGMPTRAEREPVLRRGEGGDDTTAIDQAAEDAVVARLAATRRGLRPRLRGARRARRSAPEETAVVVDPIDGSVNAKRGIPFFSFSLAVADGSTMGDVTFGYVYDFGSGEEWTAERGRGRLPRRSPSRERHARRTTIEILSFEGTTTPAIAERIGATGRARQPRARHGLARALALPSRRGPRRRRRARSSRRDRSTSLPRSSSCASAGSRSSSSRIRRSTTRRSISACARASRQPARRSSCGSSRRR